MVSEFKKVISSDREDTSKATVWNSIGMAIYPLNFVCSEIEMRRTNKAINKLAILDMPSAPEGSVIFPLINRMENSISDINTQLRTDASVSPKVILYALRVSRELLKCVKRYNECRRNVNYKINENIEVIDNIINYHINELHQNYSRFFS